MEKLLKKTSTDKLRQLKINGIEVLQRYSIFKSLFNKDNAYYLFAKPDFALIHNKQISWDTELNNKAEIYTKLNEQEKLRINAILKQQLKKLYNRALYIHENDPDNKNIIETLDRAIEIPNLSDIHIINENNKEVIVLTRWGAISDEYNAKTGLIKKLIPVKIKDLTFNVKYDNGKIVSNQNVFFKLNDRTTSIKSDAKGQIVYCDIPFWQKFEVSCVDENNEKIYHNSFECKAKDTYDIILPEVTILPNKEVSMERNTPPPIVQKVVVPPPVQKTKTILTPPSPQKKETVEEIELNLTVEPEKTIKKKKKNKAWLFWLLGFLLVATLVAAFFLFFKNNESYKHKVFISGHLVSDVYVKDTYSAAFANDQRSQTIEQEGQYNIADDFPNVVEYTLDGIAIGTNTRLIFYKSQNCQGEILFDTIGPLIINSRRWQDNEKFNSPNSKRYKESLQALFSQKNRIWSNDTLEHYHHGSLKIIFE